MDVNENLWIAEQVAAAWDRHRDRVFGLSRPASDWLVDRMAVEPGATVLETTAGTGETSMLAAERVGATGRVICTDLSPAMIDAARRGVEARRVGNVECVVMDAQKLELPDASADAVISRYGMMLLPDPAAAAREARRVLRPGGRFAYVVWGPPDRNLWIALLGAALIQRGHQPGGDPFGPGGMFSLSSPEPNRELLAGAGFGRIEVEELPIPFRFESFDDYWTLQTEIAGPLAVLIASMPAEEVAAVREAVEESTAGFRASDGGLEFPTLSLAVCAS